MNPPREGALSREDILRRRAERLAGGSVEAAHRAVAVRAAVVSVGAQHVALPAEDLREIVPLPEITALPGLPPWLLGVAHVRGDLLGVVDLAVVLGAGGERATAMVIADGAGGPLGLAVRSVLGFRDIYADELTTELGADAQRHCKAITRDLVAILDIRRVPSARRDDTAQDAETT